MPARRVLLVTGGPPWGSLVAYAHGVAEAIRDYYEVTIFDGTRALPGSTQDSPPPHVGSDRGRVAESAYSSVRYIAFLTRHARQYDIVHFCSQRLAFLATNRHRDIVTVHDVFPYGLERILPELRRSYETRTFDTLLHKWFWLSMSSASWKNLAIIADSQFTSRELIREFGYPQERVQVIPFPLSSGPVSSNKQSARQRLGLEQSRAVVLSVSTNEPRKNLEATYSLLNRISLPITLLRVGPFAVEKVRSDRRGWIRQLVAISPAMLADCYAASDVLFAPSWAEGFGVPILEAMRFGLPVVCSTAEAFAEIAQGVAALVPANALDEQVEMVEHVITNPLEFTLSSILGKERAKDSEPSKLGREFVRVYGVLLR